MTKLLVKKLPFRINMWFNSLHKIHLTSAFIAGVSFGFSQSYFHSPNNTLIENTVLDAQVTMNITQVHPSNDTLLFFWTKLSVDMPVEWEANICDNSNCYTALENSGITLPVLPGDDGLMLIHCTPHLTEGTATIRYTLYEENTPSQIDTLTWIIHAGSAGVYSNLISSVKIWSVDNTLYLEGEIEKFNTLRIIDLSGNILFQSPIENQKAIEIPSFPSNLLIVEIRGDNNIYRQKIIF